MIQLQFPLEKLDSLTQNFFASQFQAGCSFPSPWIVECDGACSTAFPHVLCSLMGLLCSLHGCTWSRSCGRPSRSPLPTQPQRRHRYKNSTRNIHWLLLKWLMYLFNGVNSLGTAWTFVSGATKHVGHWLCILPMPKTS